MRKKVSLFISVMMAAAAVLGGCGNSGESGAADSSPAALSSSGGEKAAEITELTVRFGEEGEDVTMHLEDNSTAAAIAGYVGSTEWQLPIYSFDESDVMEYYDIPSRYEIPDNSETVTEARTGDVFYSDPNRIVLYDRDAEVHEEYTKIGTFDATDAFVSAVENNPVLEGWGNQIVIIRAEQ